jgi:hypothetical protein
LCRLRQCSSATSWWKFPSVIFSVSSKDNRGFCQGKGDVIRLTHHSGSAHLCMPRPPQQLSSSSAAQVLLTQPPCPCLWVPPAPHKFLPPALLPLGLVQSIHLCCRELGDSFSLQALKLGMDVGQSSLGQSQSLREDRKEEDPAVQALALSSLSDHTTLGTCTLLHTRNPGVQAPAPSPPARVHIHGPLNSHFPCLQP